ncbi:MAG: carboxypeptidase-like regulatory domain-containing protein [Aridibacter sp.]
MFETNKKILILFSLAIFTVLSSSQNILACTCLAKPTVLDSFEDSDLVITTKLISVEKVREKQDESDDEYIKSVKMKIEKVYKGNVKVGDEITFAQGGGADCIWTYDEELIGEKFLFYLDNITKGHPIFDDENTKNDELMYYPVTCGRSTGVANAADDILFIENIEKYRGRTRISGRLHSGNKNSPSLANIEVKIIGENKIYETNADKSGYYEIIDIPAGIYVVEPLMPKGWKLFRLSLQYQPSYLYNNLSASQEYDYKPDLKNQNQIPIFVRDKRHAELNLLFTKD